MTGNRIYIVHHIDNIIIEIDNHLNQPKLYLSGIE